MWAAASRPLFILQKPLTRKAPLLIEKPPCQELQRRQLPEYNPLQYPCCGKETMVMLQVLPKRGPPNGFRTRKEYGLSETGS
jgi:hypothetical protein